MHRGDAAIAPRFIEECHDGDIVAFLGETPCRFESKWKAWLYDAVTSGLLAG